MSTQPPKVEKKESFSNRQLPRWAIASLETLKLIDWFTDALKISFHTSSAGDRYDLAVFTFVMASVILAQRGYEQVCLLMRAAKWGSSSRCILGCVAFPLLPLLPISWISFGLYNKKRRQEEGHLTVFTRRPLATLLLGLPGYGILSSLISDKNLVLHPMQAHLRAVQGVWQTLLQDLPDIIIDSIIIAYAPTGANLTFFYISLLYSCVLFLILLVTTVTEINFIERMNSIPPTPTSASPSGTSTSFPAIADGSAM
eukprot:TRINITY_DN44248_c0_g1_i1.p1 TRINITY_DN44248_c0_g1~~TRINITY_DN44248_c0_g1_i1.p1  ORF type:complete len:256 (+),score=29.09 TRINITY_DN44248_c0_g1_i1:117-884(+)